MSSSPVIIVTGASRGLGLAVAQILLTTFQAKVITISRSVTSELSDLKSKAEDSLITVQGDINDEEVVKNAVESGVKQFGRLDGLVLNAGVVGPLGKITSLSPSSPSNRSSPSTWTQAFSTNVFSLLTLIQHAHPHLIKSPDGGKVIFVSSGAAVANVSGWGCYNSTKAALNAVCRTYANEEKEVTALSIRPGMVDTAMQEDIRTFGPEGMDAKELERFTDAHKEGKLLKAEQPGYVLAALAVKGHEVHNLSGQFLNWDAQELAAFQRKD